MLYLKKIKRVTLLSLLLIPLCILASCGTKNLDSTSGSKEEKQTISTRLEVSADGEGTFVVINESKEESMLTMSSGQEIEFQLLDEKKEIVFTYSANKLFMQGIQEKKLQPGEEWEIPLNLKEELITVPNGSYTLVVWSTAEGLSDLKVETKYDWNGNGSPTTEGPEKLVVETEEVTYIGQQDLHSIEVKNLAGTTEAMRLSEVAIPFFEGLEEGKQLFVEYVVENEQKIIQSARLAE